MTDEIPVCSSSIELFGCQLVEVDIFRISFIRSNSVKQGLISRSNGINVSVRPKDLLKLLGDDGENIITVKFVAAVAVEKLLAREEETW